MYDPERFRDHDLVVDETTGTVYHRYGEGGLIDPEIDIVYYRLDAGAEGYESAIRIAGDRYLLNRRHRKAPALHAEIEGAGFDVLYQDNAYGGDLVCVHRGARIGLASTNGSGGQG
jgi:hypothetical protein